MEGAMRDVIAFDHDQESINGSLVFRFHCTATYEPPDRSVGINGGWFLDAARFFAIKGENGENIIPDLGREIRDITHGVIDRDEYQELFGVAGLDAVEDHAANLADAEWEAAYIDAHPRDDES
jgi:hypothetical protein